MPPKKPTAPKATTKPAAKSGSKPAAKPGAKAGAKPAATKTAAAAAPVVEEVAEPVYLEVPLKQFANVVFGDSDTQVHDSGKWPLICDTTNVVASFVRHRDCNFLNSADPHNMQTESIRLAVMGSLRFGKPLVVDMMDMDMLEQLKSNFNTVEEDLWEKLMNKGVMEEDYIEKLIRESDGEEYKLYNFAEMYLQKFVFSVLTTLQTPPAELLRRMCPVRVNRE